MKGLLRDAPKVVGYVHNPDSDVDVLLDTTQVMLQSISAASGAVVSRKSKCERWLVFEANAGLSYFEMCQQIYSELAFPAKFKKILMVLSDGRVEILS